MQGPVTHALMSLLSAHVRDDVGDGYTRMMRKALRCQVQTHRRPRVDRLDAAKHRLTVLPYA